MVDPQSIGIAMDQFFNVALVKQVMVYIGWAFMTFTIFGFFIFLWYIIQFKFKITYPVLHYDTGGKSAHIIKYKKDRARLVKKDGIWKAQLLLLRKYIEPFKKEQIYPGNRVNLFSINDDGTYTAMPALTFNSPAQFNYLSPEEKTWAILELKESASANETPEAVKRMYTYTIITIILCLIAVVAAVWIASKAPNQAAEAATNAASTLKNIAGAYAPN